MSGLHRAQYVFSILHASHLPPSSPIPMFPTQECTYAQYGGIRGLATNIFANMINAPLLRWVYIIEA